MDIKGIIQEKISRISKVAQSALEKDFIIGLDLGKGSLKIAQFVRTENALRLVKTDLKEIRSTPDTAIDVQETVSALKYLLRDIDLAKSKIIANINCPQTAIKKITTPYMPKSELGDGITLEAKNYFPFPIDQCFLDFEILGDIVEQGLRKYEVVVAISPIETVKQYISILEKAGIKPSAFVSSAYALQKSVRNTGIEEGKAKCFFDIGECCTELIIFKGKSLMFSRKLPVAGRDFTKAMTGVLASDRGKIQLTWDEAEKIKREIGIPQDTESRIIEGKVTTTQVLAMLRTPLEYLISEIERCFDYYREETGGGKIDSLVLYGAGVSLGGLVKSLSDGLGIEVVIGESYRFELAIGAALSAGEGVNLLPPEIKEQTRRVVRRGTFEAIATAVVLISILFYMGMKIKLNNFQKRIAVARMEFSSLEPQLKGAKAQVFANELLSQEPYWEDLLKELSNLMVDYVYLNHISMRDNVITMKGIVTALKDKEKIVSNFVLVLEKGIFNNVRLVVMKDLGENAGTEFELKCWVDYE